MTDYSEAAKYLRDRAVEAEKARLAGEFTVSVPVRMSDEALRDDFVHGLSLWQWDWWHVADVNAAGVTVTAENPASDGEVHAFVSWADMRRVFSNLLACPEAYGLPRNALVLRDLMGGVYGAHPRTGDYDFGALDADSGDVWMQACVYGKVVFG